jgi:hypothetical protein
MKTYGGVDIKIHVFLTSALVGVEWSASHLDRFTPGTHWIGGRVGPRARLDHVEKRKFLTIPGLELCRLDNQRNLPNKNFVRTLTDLPIK